MPQCVMNPSPLKICKICKRDFEKQHYGNLWADSEIKTFGFQPTIDISLIFKYHAKILKTELFTIKHEYYIYLYRADYSACIVTDMHHHMIQ